MAKLADLSPAAKWTGWAGAMFGLALAALRLALAVDPSGWKLRLEPYGDLIAGLAGLFFVLAFAVPLVAWLRGAREIWGSEGFVWSCHEAAWDETTDDRIYRVEIKPTRSIQSAAFRIGTSDPLFAETHDVRLVRDGSGEEYKFPGWEASFGRRGHRLYVAIKQPPLTVDLILAISVRSKGGLQAVETVERRLD